MADGGTTELGANMSSEISVALFGAGAMGSNHARVISEHPDFKLQVIIDADKNRASKLADQYGVRSSVLIEEAFQCDVAIVATSTESHKEVAMALLGRGKPVLVEKPLAPTMDQVNEIVSYSSEKSIPLMCGFVERFNPVMMTLTEILPEIPTHILSLRHSPETGRNLGSVVDDVLIHDVDLCLRLAGFSTVKSIYASASHDGDSFDSADALLEFGSGLRANLSANRTSQHKIRSWYVNTPEQTFEVDLLRQTLTSYRHLDHDLGGEFRYRSNTVIDIPYIRHAGEPLYLQLSHFASLCKGEADATQERAQIVATHTAVTNVVSALSDSTSRGLVA